MQNSENSDTVPKIDLDPFFWRPKEAMEHTFYVFMQVPSIQNKYTKLCMRFGCTFHCMLDCAGFIMQLWHVVGRFVYLSTAGMSRIKFELASASRGDVRHQCVTEYMTRLCS